MGLLLTPVGPGTLAGLRRMLEIYLWPRRHGRRRRPSELRRVQEIARTIIDREKPAHTLYALKVVVPTMRLVSEELIAREAGEPKPLLLGKKTQLGTSDS